MKKRIITGLLSVGILLSLGGCNSDNIEIEKRFISTGESVVISSGVFEVVYDKYTKIVYISSKNDYSVTPLLGEDKQPITIDEYRRATK